MTFTINNGKVPYIMAAGADYVSGEMPLQVAEKIYRAEKKRSSHHFGGYPVCVDGKFFFAGTTSTKASMEADCE